VTNLTVLTKATVPNGVNSTDAAAYGQIHYGLQNSTQCLTSIQTQTTSSSFQATAASATITVAASSRVKITVSGSCSMDATGTNNYVTLFRNGSNIGPANGFIGVNMSVAGSLSVNCSFSYIDSPASASALTYVVEIRSSAGAGAVEWMPFGTQTSSLTLDEIK
jgi:hypothetical protein